MSSLARTATRQPIEQRDGQRAPFDHKRGRRHRGRACCVSGIAQHQHAAIDEQAAIAVFGKPGEAVDVGHGDAGAAAAARSANRRAIATACAAAPVRWWRRAVVIAGCRQQSPSGTPPSVSRDGQIGPNCRSSSDRIVGAAIAPSVGVARPDDRTIRPAAARRCARKRPGAPRPVARARAAASARPSRPTSGLSSRDLKAVAQVVGVEALPARRHPRAADRRHRGKGAARKHVEARERQTLRAADASRRSPDRDSATAVPAPASSKTLTMARSKAARACAARSASRRLRRDSAQRSSPSTTKCRQRE